MGRFENAIQSYDKALEIEPQDVTDWINKGNAIDDLGRHEEAIKCYDRALQIDPSNPSASKNKEIALQRLHQPSSGSHVLESYLSNAVVGGGAFVGSVNSNKYHYPSCGSAKNIHPENEIWFTSSEDARAHGYVPCERCNPP